MNELHETIEKIYNLLAAIPVRGDDIETIAAARELLRQAYRQTKDAGQNAEDNGNGRQKNR